MKVRPKKLSPLKDVVLVKPLNVAEHVSSGGIVLPHGVEGTDETLALAQVLAVGAGAISGHTAERLAVDFEVGDYVLHHERSGWAVSVAGEKLRLVRELDCVCTVEVEEYEPGKTETKTPFFKEE